MAATLSINSCLRPSSSSSSLPPPPSPMAPPPIRIMSIPPWTMMSKGDDASWRSRCVSTVAGVVVGATIGLAAGGAGEVLAGEMRTADGPLEQATSAKVLRWSDKRTCPPWNANSLESVVPENLPRPLGGRSNRFAMYKGTAPAVGSSASSSVRFNGGGSSCFSL